MSTYGDALRLLAACAPHAPHDLRVSIEQFLEAEEVPIIARADALDVTFPKGDPVVPRQEVSSDYAGDADDY